MAFLTVYQAALFWIVALRWRRRKRTCYRLTQKIDCSEMTEAATSSSMTRGELLDQVQPLLHGIGAAGYSGVGDHEQVVPGRLGAPRPGTLGPFGSPCLAKLVQ